MSAQNLEQFIPPIQSDGLNTNTNTTLGGTLAVTGASTLTGAVTASNTLAVSSTATFSGQVNLSGVTVGAKQNVIDATAATTLTAAQSGSVVLLDSSTGVEVKLPATAAGLNFEFIVTKTPQSGTVGIRTPASSFISGALIAANKSATDKTIATFIADGTSNAVITMNGTTTGGSTGGTVFYATAISATVWQINGNIVGSGALATPIV